jgi:hypothetical protein
MIDGCQVIPRLVEQRPDASMLERDGRALGIMLVIRVRKIAGRSNAIPLGHKRLDLLEGPLSFVSEQVSRHTRW